MIYHGDILGNKNICDAALDVGGYNYYGYVSRFDKSWAILKAKTDNTEYRYATGTSDYATAFAAYASQTYLRPDQFNSANRNK